MLYLWAAPGRGRQRCVPLFVGECDSSRSALLDELEGAADFASVLHAASSRGMNVGAKQATRSSGWLVLRSQVTSATPHIRLFDWPSFNSACGTPGKQGSLWL